MIAREQLTKPIIRQIEELVSDIPGWTPTDQLFTLFNLIYALAGLKGDILEIGSWCGRSTSVLGLAARLTGVRTVHCIDLFPEKGDWMLTADGHHYFSVRVGDKDVEGYKGTGGVWNEPYERDIAPLYEKHGSIYGIFRDTMERKSMTDLVKVCRGTSDMFTATAPRGFRCKFAFIDGDHSYEPVCADIRNVDRFLVPGGWIAFDDAFSVYEGVNRAVTELVIQNTRYELCQQMTRKLFIARKKTLGVE